MPLGRQIGGTPFQPATTFARYLRITNLDLVINLKVMFYGDTFITIGPGLSQEFTGEIPFFSVQASSATVQWEAHAVVAA